MVSLTTVYLLSVILTSIAGIGSAFAAKQVGGEMSSPSIEVPSEQVPVEQDKSTVDYTESLSQAIQTGFGMNKEFADNVMDFIQTPVVDWNKIAVDSSELRRKFMKTLTHENLNKCPDNLKNICKLVSIKYSNMKDFIEGNPYQRYGDQTQEAFGLLSNTV